MPCPVDIYDIDPCGGFEAGEASAGDVVDGGTIVRAVDDDDSMAAAGAGGLRG